MTPKPVLGTANFGLAYGIANKRMLSEKEAFAVLEKAVEVRVGSVDTARGYGDAERILGRFFRVHGKVFDVVTKLPDGEYRVTGDVERQLTTSLDNLGLERIDTLLLHSFRSFERYSEVLLPVLDHYCSRGLIGEYGLSVYHPFEIETAIEKTRQAGFRIAALQFPVNIFDQRFLKGGYLPKLQSSAITLYGRSIFLQGLFFMDAASLGGHLNLAKPKLRQLADLAEIHCTSVEALAILFALSSGIDYIVLGVDSAAQLEKNAALISKDTSSLSPALRRVFDMLEVSDEEIILPYRWKEWTWETTGLMTQKIGVT